MAGIVVVIGIGDHVGAVVAGGKKMAGHVEP